MSKLKYTRQATANKILRVFIADTTKTDGSGLTGLVYNSAGFVCYYCREGDGAPTAVTLTAGTVGTYVSSGFVAVGATMPGWYEICPPNAAFSTGNTVAISLYGATNMVVVNLEMELDAVNYQDGALGMMSYALSSSPTQGTIGDALLAAEADGVGKWVISGTTLTLYRHDGTTVVRTFTLNSASTPTSRT